MAQHSHIDFGTLKGKVLGLPTVGASVMAEKYLGVITSVVKEGGYTANSIVNVEGTYTFKVPSGLYKITAAFPDGTRQIIENSAIWPGSFSSFDFKYIRTISLSTFRKSLLLLFYHSCLGPYTLIRLNEKTLIQVAFLTIPKEDLIFVFQILRTLQFNGYIRNSSVSGQIL